MKNSILIVLALLTLSNSCKKDSLTLKGCNEYGQLEDQDRSDNQLPWERKSEPKVIIYFETKNVTTEYESYVEQGIAVWNQSIWLDTRMVDTCPPDVNCVTMNVLSSGGGGDDGNFDSIEKNAYTIGGHIELYDKALNKYADTAGAKLNVTIHEMGHAVGLRHRKTTGILMNGDTYEDVFNLDEIDFHNLDVLYGCQE